MSITTVVRLDDHALTAELSRLAGCERESTAALVAHLAEFDARRLYEGEGFSSIFKYCTAILRLSEDAAYNRIQAARAARRFPVIVERLAAGGLSVTTVRLLAPHLTAENYEQLLSAADGKGKHEVEHLVATWFPQPDVAPSVRRLPARAALLNLEGLASETASPSAPDALPADVATAPAVSELAAGTQRQSPPARRPVVRPLAAERYEIRFTATAETLEKLRAAQDLLGHAVPSGDLAQVFDRALTLLVADLERKKFAATSRPRPATTAGPDKRHIPAAVKRGVMVRDRGRCAFVSKDGRRCGERRFLEFHHIVPRAAGGRATIDNIELRCRAHNGYAVDQYFGPGKRRTRDDRRSESGTRTHGTRSGTSSTDAPVSRATPAGG
jgi:5-methylcytosine-specific restriction endonuclease McrA